MGGRCAVGNLERPQVQTLQGAAVEQAAVEQETHLEIEPQGQRSRRPESQGRRGQPVAEPLQPAGPGIGAYSDLATGGQHAR